MSSFITVVVSNHSDHEYIKEVLIKNAIESDIGIFFKDRYINPELECIINHNDINLIFDLADSFEYNNCESLLRPWWFDNDDINKFKSRINKISTILHLCADGQADSKIDVWIGTSGDDIGDFETYETEIDALLDNLILLYENATYVPPSVHYKLVLSNLWSDRID